MLKSKYLIFLIFLIVLIKPLHSQSWHTYFGDTIWDGNCAVEGIYIDENSFIIGGGFKRIGNDTIKKIARWESYQWIGFPYTNAYSGSPSCFAKYKSKIYAGGDWHIWNPNDASNTSQFAMWDGIQWLPPGQPLFGEVRNIKVIGDSLYVVGSYEHGAKVMVFDDNVWQDLSNIEANHAASIIEYNGELLVGTNYGLWKRVGYDTWQQFPGTPQGWVNAMLVDSVNNFLYTGGSFYHVGDTIESRCIAKYDGFQWYPMQKGVMGDVWFGTIEMYRGDLYFGGFSDATALDTTLINYVARWDGEKIHSVGGGTSGTVWGIKAFQDTLIIVGNYTYVNVLNGDSIHSQGMAKWYMPPANDCRYLQPVLHAWQDEWVSEDEFYLINGEAVVNFYNNNAYVDSWEWDFGTSTGSVTASQTVEYTYNYPGTYNVQVTVTDGQCVKTAEKEIKIFLNTSISEESKQNSLNVFPNPAGEKLNIECFVPDDATEATLQIISPTGQTLKLISLSKGENKMNISTTEWDCDFVIVNLVIDNKVCNPRKVIIEKK